MTAAPPRPRAGPTKRSDPSQPAGRRSTGSRDSFQDIQRFHDPRLGGISAKILPGQFYVTESPVEYVTTLLGSCVAACIWDPEAGLGGMNHFMIPNTGTAAAALSEPGHPKYGLFAMEFLINAVLTGGGRRDRLVAKVAGGGKVVEGDAAIGAKNVRFARDYLAAENIELLGEHVEGDHARRVAFHPTTGRCRVQELPMRPADVEDSEYRHASRTERRQRTGGVELF